MSKSKVWVVVRTKVKTQIGNVVYFDAMTLEDAKEEGYKKTDFIYRGGKNPAIKCANAKNSSDGKF